MDAAGAARPGDLRTSSREEHLIEVSALRAAKAKIDQRGEAQEEALIGKCLVDYEPSYRALAVSE